ncbi:MAG: hypothetical protein U1E76_07620, partial [Planctomycetota bacterium]
MTPAQGRALLGIFSSSFCLMALVQCGGGGGGGGGGSKDGFIVASMSYGRGIDQGAGITVVSPLTLVDSDPVTGLLVPGTLRPLGEGVDVSKLVTVGLGPNFRPVVIPRNGIVVVQFSSAVDAASVVADELTDTGKVIHGGSVQVRLQSGRGVPVRLTVRGESVLIDAAVDGAVGFPASPVVFGANGEPVPDATGYLRVILPVSGSKVVRSGTGEALSARADGLGTSSTPIGLNPGNAVLDFVEQNDLFPSNLTFNGFLPDVTAPRIVRDYFVKGTIDLGAGDSFSTNSITDVAQSFSAAANQGKGEWANKLLVLRPGEADAEQHAIVSNTATSIVISGSFTSAPRDGDAYKLSRAEFFEPQPSEPIDPSFFDPDNPQNENNRDLRWFVTFAEIDDHGRVKDVNGDGRTTYTPFETVPSRSVAQVRFSEPIDIATVLPYESFRVTDDPEPDGPGFEHLGVVFEERGASIISYVAKRSVESNEDQSEYQGFLASPDGSERTGALRLTLRVVPDIGYLRERMSLSQFNAFVALGYRGLTDLGGRPLAFSNADFDPTLGYIDYSFDFVTQTTAGGEPYRNIGGLVHLFKGVPVTGNDPYSGEPGVHFADRPDFYGPRLADINLRANGFLSGAAVTFIEKPLDDDNPPSDGQFFPYPFGVAKPLNLVDGGRFQHVYRTLEASPSPFDLKGSLLDLRKIAWAPIGGNVTDDVYENIAIYAAHSEVVPITSQSAGVPDDSYSGLGQALDPETPFTDCNPTPTQKKQNYVPPLQNCVPNGTRYFVKQANLFAPPGDSHAYQ